MNVKFKKNVHFVILVDITAIPRDVLKQPFIPRTSIGLPDEHITYAADVL